MGQMPQVLEPTRDAGTNLPGGLSVAPADYQALISQIGVHLLSDRIVVRMTGGDRVSFLHGMCTANVKALAPGAVAPALFLTEHAHIIADFNLWVETDALLIEIGREPWQRARTHLERYLVADDVETGELASLGVLDIEGPRALPTFRGFAGGAAASLAPWRYVEVEGKRCAEIPRCGSPALSVILERLGASAFLERLHAANPQAELRRVDPAALDLLRLEHGLARVGVDTTERTLALEARLESAISFDKGCYVGQETIERATARGALKKRLFGIRFDGERAPAPGAVAILEGKEVGRVTSAALSPRLGPLGLAILHHSAWAPGTRLVVRDSAGELSGAVSDLPFG